ncbi:MAG: methyltransferase domain-containing protein, partial [Bacteroidales bacterium]|nr:methyltransferase domain-containing protein [Bacteroidales bacterium]
MSGQKILKEYFDSLADQRDSWKKRNRFYHKILIRHFRMIIPEGARVLELGCATGDLLHAVRPGTGVGVDFSEKMIRIAREKYPKLTFIQSDAISFKSDQPFDYIILSDLLPSLWDIQSVIHNLKELVGDRTKIIISSYNYLWEPILRLGERLHLKARQPLQNWLTIKDIENLLYLEEFEIVKVERKLLLPKYLPVLNWIFNVLLANLPGLNTLTLVNFITARPVIRKKKDYSVSIVVPARNEKGNIENAILKTPDFGTHQEFIFIEGHSTDETWEEILRIQKKYPGKDIKALRQNGKGKGNAVREAFEAA